MTPTNQIPLALRRSSNVADVVERWVPCARIRRDMFGFADIIAVRAANLGRR